MRTDEDIVFNDHLTVTLGTPGAPIEMGEYGGPEADGAVVANAQLRGMQVIDINELSDPDARPNPCSTQPMKPWPQAAPTRGHEGNLVNESAKHIRNHQVTRRMVGIFRMSASKLRSNLYYDLNTFFMDINLSICWEFG